MKSRLTRAPAVAAAKAGFSRATGYRIEADPRLPSQKKGRRGRRRPDPLAELWTSQIVPMLEAAPGIRAVAVFGELLRGHPELGEGVRRTLERRIRTWRALNGPERDVIFRQEHPPGRMGFSDFTDMGGLGASSTPTSCSAAKALWRSPRACRTHCGRWAACRSNIAATPGLDPGLSAEFRNLDRDAQEDLTRRYEELIAHYGMTPTRNNPASRMRTAESRARTGT